MEADWRWRDVEVGDVLYSKEKDVFFGRHIMRLAVKVERTSCEMWITWLNLLVGSVERYRYDPREHGTWTLLPADQRDK